VRDAAAAAWVARRAERAGASGAYNGWSHVGKFPRFGICAALARDWNLSGILFHRAMADTSAPTMPFAAEDAAPRAIEAADPLEAALAVQLEAPSESAPTPWSEPVAAPATEGDASASGTITGWDQPTDDGAAASAAPAEEQAAPPDAWAGASAEPVQEWQAESAPSDWQEARKPEAPAVPEAPGTDWTSLRSGPDWSASGGPEQPQEQAWGTPPPQQQPEWAAAAPVESEWAPPAP